MNIPSTLSFELTHPARLICLLALPVLLYFFYRSLVDFPKWQTRASLATRPVIILLLVLALSGLTLLSPTTDKFVIFAVDESTSIGAESKKKAEEFLAARLKDAPKDPFAILPFSTQPGKLPHAFPQPSPGRTGHR